MDDAKTPVPTSPVTKAPMSRRALLSGMGKAVPAVVTLYSGAALARSSNLISADSTPGAEQNKYRCLDTRSVYKTDKPKVYDLGQNPMAHVTRVDSRKDYFKPGYNGPSTTEVAADKMCADGGDYYRKDYSGYRKVRVEKGVLVSATALSSFSNNITYTDV